MKNILFCILLIAGILPIAAQQEPIFSHYRSLPVVINPAATGVKPNLQLRMGGRMQWSRFPGAPRTVVAGASGQADEHSGAGILLVNDEMGPSLRNGIEVSYAFRFPVGQPGNWGQNMLSLGVAGKYTQYRFRGASVYFQNPDDPTVTEAMAPLNIGDAAFGSYFYNDRFYAGLSCPNLIQGSVGFYAAEDGGILQRISRYYFAVAGLSLDYDNVSIEPSVLYKKVQGAPFQIEGNVQFFLAEDKLMFGIAYRTDWLVTGMLGLNARRMKLYYSAEFMPFGKGRAGALFGPSNELVLGIDLGKEATTRSGTKSGYYKGH
ncbi:MAG: type IX secretion system membrane protein PorP/SprF [Bacteroidetes bacterium]|jgi:type IX secretion system PorP/SprF family membrane protein|nr:MAG: type IX secretion system membrane protein PorP/SprF [Bacteroidota bacterium]